MDPVLTTTQLGRILQSARRARGLTQQDLGSLVGLSQKRISALELRPGSITAEQLLSICGALGLELSIQKKPLVAREPGLEW